MAAVEVESLTISYGAVRAVAGLSFTAEAGQVTCVLGPNGAGKTSTIEALEGLRAPQSGRLAVLGLDPRRDHRALTERMGVMLQEGGIHPGLRPPEVLRHAAALYARPLAVGGLLDRLGLAGREGRTYRQLSGGEQRRLALAVALVGRPQVAFLDEPTAGVDPQGRQVIRQVIADLRRDGVTVLLTTHDLDEAERVADRVVIVDRGELVAEGTLDELVRGRGQGPGAPGSPGPGETGPPEEVRFGAPPGIDTAALAAHLGDVPVTEVAPGDYAVAAAPTPATIAALTAWLAEQDLALADLRAGRQRLEDVYLRLTSGSGRAPGEEAGGVKALVAQVRVELTLTFRNGEALLLTLGIPVAVLVFFSLVDVLPIAGDAVDFLAPGTLALAVLATAFTNLAIATGFDRSYGVLKRLGTTPLGRPRLVGAKAVAVLVVVAVQAVVLTLIGLALGWRPDFEPVPLLAAVVLSVVAFTGLALVVAGRLPALVALAAANALFIVLLLLSGMVFPLTKLPPGLRDVARALPSTALTDAARGSLTAGVAVPGRVWPVLAVWAVVAAALAVALFRWEPND